MNDEEDGSELRVKPRLSIVVPVRDDSQGIVRLLRSVPIAEYGRVEVIINDDPRSLDPVEGAIESMDFHSLAIRVIHSNQSRAQGRLEGARHAHGDILLHLDSDMELTQTLLAEIVDRMDSGSDALVVPEESVGVGFWARCKVLEKACWQGDPDVEAARAVTVDVYWSAGGHDPALIWGEDKDLDLRVRDIGAQIGVTDAPLRHDERNIGFWESLGKKRHYAGSAGLFAAKHPEVFRNQRSVTRLPVLIRRAWDREHDPRLVAGLFLLKAGEFTAVGLTLGRQHVRRKQVGESAFG